MSSILNTSSIRSKRRPVSTSPRTKWLFSVFAKLQRRRNLSFRQCPRPRSTCTHDQHESTDDSSANVSGVVICLSCHARGGSVSSESAVRIHVYNAAVPPPRISTTFRPSRCRFPPLPRIWRNCPRSIPWS
jgi:hypothetical protein